MWSSLEQAEVGPKLVQCSYLVCDGLMDQLDLPQSGHRSLARELSKWVLLVRGLRLLHDQLDKKCLSG